MIYLGVLALPYVTDKMKKKHNGVDRRKYPRINANINYAIISDAESIEALRNMKDIGAGGVAFFTQREVDPGAVLSLFINLPDLSNFHAKAKVVWCEKVNIKSDKDIHCELGIKFIEIKREDNQRLAKYVFIRLDQS
ncbi:MAG: PilZ domain-containing protein [Candidatus Omnitrophota bacterium]